MNSINSKSQSQSDRRRSERLPIQREVRYHMLSKRAGDDSGEGATVNMSSAGILFTTSRMLLPGRRVEITISWPAQLNQKCALKLVARGRVVRYEEGVAAMEIQQYEFRTHAATGDPVGTSV